MKNNTILHPVSTLLVDKDGSVNWNRCPINGNSIECPGHGKDQESISLAAVSMATSPHSKNFLASTLVLKKENDVCLLHSLTNRSLGCS